MCQNKSSHTHGIPDFSVEGATLRGDPSEGQEGLGAGSTLLHHCYRATIRTETEVNRYTLTRTLDRIDLESTKTSNFSTLTF